MFGYFVDLAIKQDPELIMSEIKKHVAMKKIFEEFGLDEMIYEDWLDPVLQLIRDIGDRIGDSPKGPNGSVTKIEETFNDEEGNSCIVQYLRVSLQLTKTKLALIEENRYVPPCSCANTPLTTPGF
jgi:hypothetical protein